MLIVALLCLCNSVRAQFAPAADLAGTTAIPADSTIFTAWATGCTVQRGPVNIANTSLGLASAGADSDALGPSDDVTVSLGDGGWATVTFANPVYNGPGFDFAVFENGFITNDSNLAFLELGFVEVSTDGSRFVRFPSICHVEDTVQTGSFGATDCSQLYNLAGKYVARYGTPFDLEELVDSPGIDVNNINYIKVVDVVGSIDSAYATRDHYGNIVNDPWPTPYASCGFDLDAVGVINARYASGIKLVADNAITAFPNPVYRGGDFSVRLTKDINTIKLFDVNGQTVYEKLLHLNSGRLLINTSGLSSGIYFITAETATERFYIKLIVE